MINFDKMRKVAGVIREVMMHQQQAYIFHPVEVIQNYFKKGLHFLPETECFKMSREIETKEEILAVEEKEKKRESKSKK